MYLFDRDAQGCTRAGRRFAAGACMVMSAFAHAQPTTDGNSAFTMTDANTSGTTVRTGTGGGGGALFTAGGDTTDQLFQQWWWYRVNGVNPREFAFSGRTSSNASGNTHTLEFTEPEGFNATLVYVLTDGADAPAAANISATLTINNTSSAPLDMAVFAHLDYDLEGSGTDAATLLEPGRIQITDQPTSFMGQFLAVDPTAYQVAAFSTVRGLLTDADIDNLAGTGLPFAAADFTGAFQWNATIPAGGSRVYRAAFSLNTPATASGPTTCRADINNMGGVTLQDLFDFLSAWFAMAPAAEFDGAPGITLQDLFDFLGLWFTGCP